MKDLFKLNMPFFDKDGGAAGDPAPEAKTDDGAGGTKADEAGKSEPEKMFSQAELEHIIKERLEREKKKQEDAALKATEAAERKALEEQGKHKELADKALKDAESARAAKEAAESALKNERIRYTVLTQAMLLSFAEPEDAMKLLDFSDVEFTDDGKPKAETITKKLEELAKAKPYLVKSADEKQSFGTPKKQSKTTQPKDQAEPKLPSIKF